MFVAMSKLPVLTLVAINFLMGLPSVDKLEETIFGCFVLSFFIILKSDNSENKPKVQENRNSRALLGNIAVSEVCHVALTSVLLGSSNICDRFKQCCTSLVTGREKLFVPCYVPCDAVVLSSAPKISFDWNHLTQEYDTKSQETQRDLSINIREVTEYNKQFIPPFQDVGFAFRDLSELNTFTSVSSKYRDLSKYYNKMIRRLYDLARDEFPSSDEQKRQITCRLTVDEFDMFLKICEDFAVTNNKKMISDLFSITLRKATSAGTTIHFDGRARIIFPVEGGTIIRVWIPLSNIDNYPMAVGDVRSYFLFNGVCNGERNINKCAKRLHFDHSVWYHQRKMTPLDAIFWNLKAVPHGSMNLGEDRSTKERFALLFDFVVKEIL